MSLLAVPVRSWAVLSSSTPWVPTTRHLTGQSGALAPATSVGEDLLGLAVIAGGAWAAHALLHWSWGWSVAASVGFFVVLPIALFAVLGGILLGAAAASHPGSVP